VSKIKNQKATQEQCSRVKTEKNKILVMLFLGLFERYVCRETTLKEK